MFSLSLSLYWYAHKASKVGFVELACLPLLSVAISSLDFPSAFFCLSPDESKSERAKREGTRARVERTLRERDSDSEGERRENSGGGEQREMHRVSEREPTEPEESKRASENEPTRAEPIWPTALGPIAPNKIGFGPNSRKVPKSAYFCLSVSLCVYPVSEVNQTWPNLTMNAQIEIAKARICFLLLLLLLLFPKLKLISLKLGSSKR